MFLVTGEAVLGSVVHHSQEMLQNHSQLNALKVYGDFQTVVSQGWKEEASFLPTAQVQESREESPIHFDASGSI